MNLPPLQLLRVTLASASSAALPSSNSSASREEYLGAAVETSEKHHILFLSGNLPPKRYEERFPQNVNRTQQNSNSLNISMKRMFLE